MFRDCFFELETGQILERSANLYASTYLDKTYDPTQSLDTAVVDFIRSFCNYDNFQIHLLRYHLKNVILGMNLSQMAMYFVGPGLTGKSTWTNFLIFLMGDLNIVWEVARLGGRFNTTSLRGRRLLTFPDIDSGGLTGKRSAMFKSLSALDMVATERKHAGLGNYKFQGNVVINGNTTFDLDDPKVQDDSGLARRVMVFPCTTVAENPNPYLPELLQENCVPLVRWALGCTIPPDLFLKKVEVVSENLQGHIQSSLRAFVLDSLTVREGHDELIGAKMNPDAPSLYNSYLIYCEEECYDPLPPRLFSRHILEPINALGLKRQKKRTSSGMAIPNIKRTWKGEQSFGRPEAPYIEEYRAVDPFEMPQTIDVEAHTIPTTPSGLLGTTEDLTLKEEGKEEPKTEEEPNKTIEGSSNEPKRKRGRPRKNPKPEERGVRG